MFTSSVSSLRKCSVAVPRSKLLNREPELRKKYIASCLTLIPTMLPDAHPPSFLMNSLNHRQKGLLNGTVLSTYLVSNCQLLVVGYWYQYLWMYHIIFIGTGGDGCLTTAMLTVAQEVLTHQQSQLQSWYNVSLLTHGVHECYIRRCWWWRQ